MRHSEYSPSSRRTEMMMTGHHQHLHHHQDRHFHSDLVASLQLVRGTTTTTTSSGMSTATFDADRKPVVSKMSDHRRSNKPIMEKRRRARINSCLGELKGLILQAMKKDPSRHSKLEKADILEMTVKHLQNVQRQQMAMAVSTDPTVMTKFRAGFNECASEVASYVNRIDGVDTGVRQRLVGHLRSCITGLSHLPPVGLTSGTMTTNTYPSASDALNLLSKTPLTSIGDDTANKNGSAGTMWRMLAGLHLLPSRLPNGDIAFVLPHQHGGLVRRADDRSSASPPLSSSSDMSGDENEDDDDDRGGAEPSSTMSGGSGTTDRRLPSAFTSVQSGLPPVIIGAANGSGSSTCTVTSSTGSTFSPTSTSSNGDVVDVPGSSRQPSADSKFVKPDVSQANSNACSTDKMWRPW